MQKALALFALLVAVPPVAAAAEPASQVAGRPAAQFAAHGLAAHAAAPSWPHEQSDLRPHPQVVWGKLDNGLRYAIRPTRSAPARASLRMLVLAGSGHESDEQQGVAHFLEHMAFNGTKHFAAGETFEYFQRLGMSFGAHTNAITEIDRTTYSLELPRANEELMNDGVKLFRDFLDGMLLDEQEIEKERGVVLSEQTARNTAAYRSSVANIRAALPGTKAAERMPIGKTEIIRTAKRRQFVDFYETWYTPGRTVIVAAGDFDPATVERLIRTHFADARAKRGEAAETSLGKLRTDLGLRARFASVPDAGGTTVSLVRSTPVRPNVERIADQRDDLVDTLVDRMFSTRLEQLTEMKDTPVQAVGTGDERLYGLAERRHISARCRPEKWTDALGLVERETRRALLHGFRQSELATAKQAVETFLDYYAAQLEMQQPSDIADTIVKSVVERTVYSDPKQMLPLLKGELPKIAEAECEARFRRHWATDDLEIAVTGDAPLKEHASEKILAAFTASAATPVESTAESDAKEFDYTDFGPAGEIVARGKIDDLGIVQATFANNVRVNVKPTSFEKNKVRVIVRFGGGLLEMPAGKPGLNLLAASSFINGGLKKMTLPELNRKLDGKFVNITFGVAEESFQIGGSCLTRDLELQLQLCTAYLTEPAFRPETEREFFSLMEGVYSQREHTLEGKLRYDGAAFLRSGDPRYVLPSRQELGRLSVADVEAWLAKPLAEGYLEVSLVGDVDPDAALEFVAKTLGALPKRAAAKPDFRDKRRVKFPVGAEPRQFTYTADADRALATVHWPVPGVSDIGLNRRLNVLHLVLADRLRLKLREELGAAYTPETQYFSSYAFPEYGFIGAYLYCDAATSAELAELTREIAAELAAGSISDDEFVRAIKPYLSEIEEQRRDNGYWLGAICDCHERPEGPEIVRSKLQAYSTMAKADVEKLARQYLTREGATTITIAPAAAATTRAANVPAAAGAAQ